MKFSPVLITIAVIACLAFPPLAVFGLIVLAATRITGFVVAESPTSRIAGARSAQEWFDRV